MLFVLDNDVSALVARMLRDASHKPVMIRDVGLGRASDDEVSVFAHDRKAILLTHDREFTRRRSRNAFGHHVQLACKEWEAHNVLRAHLPEVLHLTGARETTVLKVTPTRVRALRTQWR